MNELIEAPDGRGPYKIAPKLDRALAEYVANGGNVTKAAQAIGIRRERLSRALQKQHVKDRLQEHVSRFKETSGLKALSTIDALMSDSKSDYVKLEAAKTMADRAGHAPPKGEAADSGPLIVNINLG